MQGPHCGSRRTLAIISTIAGAHTLDEHASTAALGLVAGVAGKIALDVALLMQFEVAEAFEPAGPGRGGSSTMPHKRNPVGAASVAAAARRAGALVAVVVQGLPQEHERAVGAWQAEWQSLGELLRLAGGAAARVAETLAGLEVDTARMRANLDATHGLLLAERVMLRLATALGRSEAHELVERASGRAGGWRGRASASPRPWPWSQPSPAS